MTEPADPRLRAARTAYAVRSELNVLLREAMARPDFSGVGPLEVFISSARLAQGKQAMAELHQEVSGR